MNSKPESISLASRAVVKTPPHVPPPGRKEKPGTVSIEIPATTVESSDEQKPATSTTVLMRNGDATTQTKEVEVNTETVARDNKNPMRMLVVGPMRVCMDIFLLVLVWLPTVLLAGFGQPFERGFYCDDESIRYPLKESTVPNWLLYLVGASLPIICILTIETYRMISFEPRLYKKLFVEPYHQVCGRTVPPLMSNLYIYLGYFAFGAALCQGLTDLGKYSIGRLRPHFYNVCKPAIDCAQLPKYMYVIEPNCTTTDLVALREARLSFPSGHSSFGCYTMFFLVMYIHARLAWPMVSLLMKHVLQQLCVVLAIACALSRISDYRHHWSDVLSGVVLGTIVSMLTACHMLGIFRQPHCIFSKSRYMALPQSDYSFGGDHFHSAAEMRLICEQNFPQQVIEMNDVKPSQPAVTKEVLKHGEHGHKL